MDSRILKICDAALEVAEKSAKQNYRFVRGA